MNELSANLRPTVTLHMVASIDGFVAPPDNSVRWLEAAEHVYEAGQPADDADVSESEGECFVLGSHTYELALQLGWPYGDVPTFVATSRPLRSDRPSVKFWSGDPRHVIERELAPRFRGIWVVGGASLGRQFLELGLVDEIRLTIAPILLGYGLRMFGEDGTERLWLLQNVVPRTNGYVELRYRSRQASCRPDA